ncbi:methionine-S-sulfoxide reductase [Paenibacillus baekrokdamisoli]|uniref:Peptide methionine sulfoxide reductase MsrA n=1 Tax=Paenibacillus baekrokdamisoli TaxID=1712516 RepID=A0A3G9JAR4_9BACL|nr:peptide-methionine (S)-S-oxide reductase MsrA [Paenibacillus baekrokdamisoli]MBB3067981.1 peptide-methionine (S)-S-oxide reductase [Paenibacillus baekrokdamisoli]BBH22971.1 methionine-S-sulfoxide reductase [Paenibacillus baekrokdamisoli]
MNNRDIHDNGIEPSFSTSNVQTVTLGMGCFWSPEALFGHLPGVIRTSVGYAGGSSIAPTYREMGDHTETVQIDFDPEIITFETILDMFWNNHNPMNINDYKGRQYRSLLLYCDGNQQEVIQQVLGKRKELGKGEPETEIAPYTGFYLAEDRHQKYYLKRYPHAMERFSTLYASQDERILATLAARLNGLAKGYTNLAHIINEIQQWPTSSSNRNRMIELIKQIRW